MADSLNFDLVSPERSLASFEATSVQIPGSEGDMTAMANHEPVLTTLRPGILSVSAAGGVSEYVVTGGFAEVTAQGVTVIAERAMAKADVTQADMDGIVAGAAEAVERASEEAHVRLPARCSLMSRLWPLPWVSTPPKGSDKIRNGPHAGPFFSFIIISETKLWLHETHVFTYRWEWIKERLNCSQTFKTVETCGPARVRARCRMRLNFLKPLQPNHGPREPHHVGHGERQLCPCGTFGRKT